MGPSGVRGVVAVAVALVLVAAGCDRDRGGSGPGAEDASAERALRLALVTPASLDPARAKTIDELIIADQLFDGLVAYDPETLAPVPAVAASWTSTPDQQHWDFTLDPGATFANGRAITASDVEYTLERIVAMGRESTVADLLEPVTGYRAMAVDRTATELSGVTAVSATQVRIDLDAPLADLPLLLGNPAFGIVPREAVEAAPPAPPFAEEPVGSGPFRIAARDAGERLTLVRAPGRTTRLRRVDVLFHADKAAAYDAFVAGRVDWSEVPADRVDAAAERYGRDAFAPYVAELFYAFNLRNPVFADARVREAIVRAVDRDAIVRDVYGGTVDAITGLVVPGVEGASDDACGSRCSHDPERSRALLAELAAAGVTLPEIQLDHDDDRTQTAVAEHIERDLEAVGFSVARRAKPLAEYQQFAVSGEQQLFRLGWVAAYPSPDAFLTPLFLTGSPNNLTGFSDPAVDQQLTTARTTGDEAQRVALYRQAERDILDQLPVLPIARFSVHAVAGERVRGLRMTTMGTFDAAAVWLDG